MANYCIESRNIDLKIVSLNVNFLISNYKRLALSNFLDCHNPDILMLNKTKLNDKHVLYFENYNLIRDDKIRGIGGGTAIIVNSHHNFKKVELGVKYESLEATIIRINLLNGKVLLVAAIYARKKRHSTFINELKDVFTRLQLEALNVFYILRGD
ncbi:hypothetical protein M0802_012587 [Mischocyttarus mexicanus]|nr:hypothetical protein M0802_012587 [Mischocyttarus mexicanus]